MKTKFSEGESQTSSFHASLSVTSLSEYTDVKDVQPQEKTRPSMLPGIPHILSLQLYNGKTYSPILWKNVLLF